MYNRQNMEKRQRFLIRKLTVTFSYRGFLFGTLQPVSTEAAATEVVATAAETRQVAATASEKPAESGATAPEATPKER